MYNTKGMFTIYEGDSWKKESLPLMPCRYGLYPENGFDNHQYFNDFKYNNKTYFINSVVKLTEDAQKFLGADNIYSQIIQHEVTNTGKEVWAYVVKIVEGNVYHTFTTVPPDQLVEEITTPTILAERGKCKTEYYSDFEDPDVIVGWIAYVVVMIGSLIFIDFGAIWGFASIVFFVWRHQRLKKPERHNYGFD